MTRVLPPDHPQRYAMTNELHARPFPALAAPCQGVHLAIKPVDAAAERDPDADRGHLMELVERFGAVQPAKGADHYFGEVGRVKLKWERHTEFVSYTIFEDGPADAPFAVPVERFAPAEWLASAPGSVVSAIRLHVDRVEGPEAAEEALKTRVARHFVAESLAAAHVGGRQATVMSDFRIHEDGLSRMAVLVGPEMGARRLGRIALRLFEIETYRTLAMFALPEARALNRELNAIERSLTTLVADIAAGKAEDRETLAELTRLSAELEKKSAQNAFRFGASGAYAALVRQRIEVILEERAADRQLIREFMARRFEPAMRTAEAAQRRQSELAGRASRAASLLSARVNVAVESQNQDLLESMNRRAELQLRLQRTVEGLSVVAISYYAVSLAGYLIAPLAERFGVDPGIANALVAVPIILAVWGFIRRIRRELEKE